VAGVGDEVAVILVRVPGVVAPVVGGLDFVGTVTQQAPLEVVQRVRETPLQRERREVRTGGGDEAGLRVDGRRERRDVREAAEDLGGVSRMRS
jgi:hypothetical protein